MLLLICICISLHVVYNSSKAGVRNVDECSKRLSGFVLFMIGGVTPLRDFRDYCQGTYIIFILFDMTLGNERCVCMHN